mmetsp:Transcript_14607/g.21464  ORF Transcript_14607/g.21464 Transcript_14607/m.21464 type:complete len:231 (+) Transcript_14607:131-823(+)|eukprot:CAMPEP_0197238144 /NCGR_PEP_ID=MMETSP1429-20130617/4725_1 /TAXON_ID=49237 /ORGANISM="Chaetoceros  sp., Strain UNC1202" /LENGTH=230 /DNA_ID=CAMNT_0042697247 /DNA_START=86 /DNA_END=778 /DNA_ORIENTATION=-
MSKTETEKSTTEEDEEVVLLQVDTGDIVKLKQILDETVANTFLVENTLEGHDERARNIGLEEDHRLNNMKLILMFVACVFAMMAQFSPLPFPESRIVLGSCCAAYFILSGVLQLMTTFWDKDCILITKVMPKKDVPKSFIAKNPKLMEYGLRLRTIFPKCSEFYSVVVEFEGLQDSPFVKKTWSVGQFFDKEGMFDEYGLQYEVEALFRKFANGNFDKADKSGIKKEKAN